MLNESKIVTFIATKQTDSAKNFYEKTLGLRLVYEDAFAIVFDANGIMLRVQKLQEHTPPNYTVLGWDVGDIHTEIKELIERGVRCERYEWLEQMNWASGQHRAGQKSLGLKTRTETRFP